jgi:hypothetical protein
MKDLLKRLKNVEQFKEESIKELKELNSTLITDSVDNLRADIQKKINDQLEHKGFLLNKVSKQLEDDITIFEENQKHINEARETALFIKEFHHLLLLKLINKGVLSHREKTEIEQRAEKHVQKS